MDEIIIIFMKCNALSLTFIFFWIFYRYTSIRESECNFSRTAKGEEINKKLEGLKNYLRDYSMLNEREDEELELWEDYLIYSVMFGQNKKIIDEYSKWIKKF